MGTWISSVNDSTDLKARKNHFVSAFGSLGCEFIGSKVISGFVQQFESVWSLVFHLLSALISFAYAPWNSMMTEFLSKDKLSEKDAKLITALSKEQKACVNGCPVISYSMARSLRSPKFIYVLINSFNKLDQGIADR